MDIHEDQDLLTIQISAIEHWAYCPRQCALIHIDHIFEENIFTIIGSLAHEKADEPLTEWRDEVRIEYALPLWSDSLGLSGRADCVEFHGDGTVYPVERKLGKKRKQRPDDLQLCAQVFCLEEMLAVHIPKAAIYSIKSRKRREVEITDELRASTMMAVVSIRDLLNSCKLPEPVQDNRCNDCSLINVCGAEVIQTFKTGDISVLLKYLFDIGVVDP